MPADETSYSIGDAAEALLRVTVRLDPIVTYFEQQLARSSAAQASLRSHPNGLLRSGTIQFQGVSGAWTWQESYVVPFARIAYIDSQGFGPYLFSVEGDGQTTGPGKYNSFTAGGDAGTIPFVGRDLFITSAHVGATAPTLFLAVFTTTGDADVIP